MPNAQTRDLSTAVEGSAKEKYTFSLTEGIVTFSQ